VSAGDTEISISEKAVNSRRPGDDQAVVSEAVPPARE
jgi:hypothetical protein